MWGFINRYEEKNARGASSWKVWAPNGCSYFLGICVGGWLWILPNSMWGLFRKPWDKDRVIKESVLQWTGCFTPKSVELLAPLLRPGFWAHFVCKLSKSCECYNLPDLHKWLVVWGPNLSLLNEVVLGGKKNCSSELRWFFWGIDLQRFGSLGSFHHYLIVV